MVSEPKRVNRFAKDQSEDLRKELARQQARADGHELCMMTVLAHLGEAIMSLTRSAEDLEKVDVPFIDDKINTAFDTISAHLGLPGPDESEPKDKPEGYL